MGEYFQVFNKTNVALIHTSRLLSYTIMYPILHLQAYLIDTILPFFVDRNVTPSKKRVKLFNGWFPIFRGLL